MWERSGKRTLTEGLADAPSAPGTAATPGKRTLTEGLIMRQRSDAPAESPSHAGDAFAAATSGAASEVPFRRDMERSFGEDFSGVRAHLGDPPRAGLDALGANAAARSDTIAFGTATPDRALVAHELTHVVQQRRHGGGGVQGKATLSQPGDRAEAEADDVARRVVAGEQVTVSATPSGAIHRDIKEPHAKVPLGEFAIDMKKFEGSPGDTVGETGTVKFTPGAKAPDSTSIRLTQIVKDIDLTAKADYKWTGSEANRNKMMTSGKDESYTTTATDTLKSIALQFYGDPARHGEIYAKNKAVLKSSKPDDTIGAGVALTIPASIEGGFFVDHKAGDPKAKVRSSKAKPNVPQDYVWPGEESPPKNQHGSKAGTTIVPASLDDTPGSPTPDHYFFETAARSDDTGIYYGSMHWSFKMDAGKVSEEKWHVTEGVSHTFLSAVDEFNKFYKNTYTVMAGDTLASIAQRYLGSAAKADDIYNANKALIPDKAKLTPGVQLVIPGVSPTT